jgi:DNA-binding MarR family transcriptional regulator
MAERLSIADQVEASAREAGPEFDRVTLALTLSLYRAMSAFDRAHSDELAPLGLSVTQFNVLSVLHRVDTPLTMGELAQAVSVRSANLTAVADSLASRGFVKRALNPDDRRSFLVSITPRGDRFMSGFLPGHWRMLQELTAGLSEAERARLAKLLDKLLGSLPEPGQPPPAARTGARRGNGTGPRPAARPAARAGAQGTSRARARGRRG